jgi:hypothetical protein
MSTTESGHHVELEVGGEEIPLLKQLLNRIELNPEITRVRIEVESDAPILTEPAAEEASEDEEVSEAEERTDDREASEDEPATQRLIRSTRRGTAPEDVSEGDGFEDKIESIGELADTGENAIRYLIDTRLKRPFENGDHPTSEELGMWAPSTVNVGTQRFNVLATLYRCRGYMTTGQVHGLLEGTPWEAPYKSVSAALSKAKADGYVQQHQYYDGYQLTTLGRHLIRAQVKEATEHDTYPIKTADKIADGASAEKRHPPKEDYAEA